MKLSTKMETVIKANGERTASMAKEYTSKHQVQHTLAILKMDTKMERVRWNTVTEMSTRDNGRMGRNRATVCTHGKTVTITMENGTKMQLTGRECQ